MPTDSTESVFVGVDTYADTHHVAVVDSVGRHLGAREFPTRARLLNVVAMRRWRRGLLRHGR